MLKRQPHGQIEMTKPGKTFPMIFPIACIIPRETKFVKYFTPRYRRILSADVFLPTFDSGSSNWPGSKAPAG
jgi:hypothetical protein